MTIKKATLNDKPKSRKRPGRKSRLGQFFHLVTSTPVRQLILIAVIVVLLYVFWGKIVDAAESLVKLFGWGLVFIAIAFVTLVVRIWRRKFTSFIFHWHRWLGSIVFILAVWGILAFFRLGGDFGLRIISFPSPDFIDVR